jgi:hypothetical protein
MAEVRKFNESTPRGALADAAERFDRLARVVKDQQLAETRSGPRIALTDAYTASPDEAWAKKFMTQAIGPAIASLQPPAMPVFVPMAQPPLVSQGFAVSPAVQAKASMPDVRPGNPPGSSIGGEIGKGKRKRSFFARLFGAG